MKKILFASLLTGMFLLAPAALAASSNFTPSDLGLDILSADQVSSAAVGKVFGVADQYLAKVPSSLKGLVAPVHQFKTGMQSKVLSVSGSKAGEVSAFLGKYRTLTPPHLAYEQVDMPNKAELKPLAEKANSLLKNAYKVMRTVNLANDIVKTAQGDVANLKKGDMLVNGAGLGIVLISVNNMSLNAYQTATGLEKEFSSLSKDVEAKTKAIQAKIEANPFDALSMGEELNLLLSLGSKLGTVSGDLAQSSQKIPGLVQETGKLIAQVKF